MSTPSKIKLGTCAWSFDAWRGRFYPGHLPQHDWLEFYSRYFTAVEIDSTFFHTPGAHAVEHWLECTPPGFLFTCKMPKRITHDLKLCDCRAEVRDFLAGIAPLQPKLGPVVVQLPAHFSLHHDEAVLKHFVKELPDDLEFAVEFRHADWHLPRVVHLFEQEKVGWVWADLSPPERQNQAPFEFLPQPTDYVYVRLLGDPGTLRKADGEERESPGDNPRDSSLESWALKIGKHLPECAHVYVFAHDHFEGFAPLTCQRLGARLGVELRLPDHSLLDKADAGDDRQMDLL